MAIRIYLEDVLKARNMTSKELCGLVGITEANLSILRSGRYSRKTLKCIMSGTCLRRYLN